MMLLALLGACSQSKKTGVNAAAAAPIQGSSDASEAGSGNDEDSSTALDDCDEEKKGKGGDEDEAEAEYEDDEDEAALAPKKDKGNKVKKECPVPGTTASTPAATTGTVSLAEGQKIYAASCQGCHGALPGEKQGASAQSILSASSVGPHKGITPWPAGPGSALSAQDAAASLAAAMK
jgi:hypothetical protein